MVNIWKEKITLLDAFDRGRLYGSVVGVSVSMDEKITSVSLQQEFNEYGIYVERGTGRNTPRGNSGDIGRDNPRKKKPWMTRKYLASMFNLREFMADSLGMEICLAMTNALEKVPDTRDMSQF
ncbi:MAG: hypothetical protein NC095_07755 [Muribaculum sp.]|nr:hypothetical protein [Muribaculum sp.]